MTAAATPTSPTTDATPAAGAPGHEAPGRTRGRPRDPQVDQAILGAVVGILSEQGFDALTMDAVAGRAGVAKASVYRRYANRVELLEAACVRVHARAPPRRRTPARCGRTSSGWAPPWCRPWAETDTGRLFPAMLGAAAAHPEVREALGRFTSSRRSPSLEAIRRGVARGELGPRTDPDLVADLLSGSIVYRVLVRGGRVGPRGVEQIVDTILGGAALGPGEEQG